ncbi:hypothetical protein [Spirosoma panaciterrae]|uniref:hypothetical protein n=1 Tax=Spirosoma panaciterrae TaxID=496058 RepID=UPI00037A6F29|nr:hypothetical protein [Spirosoma panaciterrae]
MNRKERTQVWARKDELSKALRQLPADDKRSREYIQQQIETCNQALIQDKFELIATE